MITHIAMVHSETTTGMLNPIEEVAALAKEYGKRYIVDAMSSFGGIPLDIAALNIDYLISSANKCIQGRAGLRFRHRPRIGAGHLQRPSRARCRWIFTPSGAVWRITTASGASPHRPIPCWPFAQALKRTGPGGRRQRPPSALQPQLSADWSPECARSASGRCSTIACTRRSLPPFIRRTRRSIAFTPSTRS